MPITTTSTDYNLPEVPQFARYELPKFKTDNQNNRRAYGEVAALTNQNIGSVEREAQTARQRALEELANSSQAFDTTVGGLDFSRNTQESALDEAMRQLGDESTFGAERLQSQINPAILAARQSAARSGLLNSTVAIDRVNSGLNPISQGLVDIERKRQTGSQDLGQKRADLIAKYTFERQNALQGKTQEQQQIQNAFAQLLQQAQQQSGDIMGSVIPSVIARKGELRDQSQQFGLQQEQIRKAFEIELKKLAEQRYEFQNQPK